MTYRFQGTSERLPLAPATVEDMKTGLRAPRSTVLTEADEAAIVAFRHGGAKTFLSAVAHAATVMVCL